MECLKIRLSGIVEESIVDGPGIRYAIFTQGCKHNCYGCHNPQTHDLSGGYLEDCNKLVEQINDAYYLKGVTFSGGEPFLQSKECAYIASKLNNKYDIIAYTGYLFEDLIKLSKDEPSIMDFLKQIDILIDGPFKINLRSLDLKFKGSKNQRMILVKESLEKNEIVLYPED